MTECTGKDAVDMVRYYKFSFLIIISIALGFKANAQADGFRYKFYGQIRSDLFYNSRSNVENVDGLFYLYPKDKEYDSDNNDINSSAEGSMYMLYSRLGLDVTGPTIGSANTSAKIEVDFRGSGTSFAMPRIRHAYVNLKWENQELLIGQTWHPMFGEVSPSMLNLSSGAPFQPFSRSPQIRFRNMSRLGVQITLSAIWQQQYSSIGPAGSTPNYLKYSGIPEIFIGADIIKGNSILGLGWELLSIKPRKTATLNGDTYKVNERVTSVSIEAHAKITTNNIVFSGKTLLANNLTQASMIGGYGVTSVDKHNGEAKYTPFKHSMTWLNVIGRGKWQPGIFVGYLKNLGTGKEITGTVYGRGLDIDQLVNVNLQLSYKLPNWKVGVECGPSIANYGTISNSNGRVTDAHSVTNFRVLGVVIYNF